MLLRIAIAICVVYPCTSVIAAVVEYQTEDRDQWFIDVGGPENVSTVDFVGFADFTPVTDQWADLGVNFSGFVVTVGESPTIFPNDGWGLRGQPDINMTFDAPINWIAIDFPGVAEIELFSEGQLIYSSQEFGVGGIGRFGGLISDEPFDAARIFRTSINVTFIDDLFFGPVIAVPAPGALVALVGGLFVTWRKRHRA